MRELAKKYAWADTDHDLAWTVAIIEGKTDHQVLELYGGNPSAMLGKMSFGEANDIRNRHFGEFGVLQLLSRDEHVVAIEPNGWIGNMPEIACQASGNGGHFFSAYWSPVAYQIIQARNGQVTASFDPNFIGLPAGANDLLPGWVGDNDFPLEHLKSASLAAIELQTGTSFDRAWLDTKLPTYRTPDPDEFLKGNTRLP